VMVVDHPSGSVHPRYTDIVYPANYGCLEGTVSVDGAGIDVWVGASGDPRPGRPDTPALRPRPAKPPPGGL
jgi:inorganic pyrophosphatase